MKTHEFILSNTGDLAMNSSFRPLIFNKTKLAILRLTKKGMTELAD